MASKLPPFTPLQLLHIVSHMGWAYFTRPRFPDFNPDDFKNFYPDPIPVYRRMLKEAPIFYAPSQLSWMISHSYNTVYELMADPRLATSVRHWKFAPQKKEQQKNDLDRLLENMLMLMPKKDHMRIRKLAIPAFSPSRVEKLRADIRATVNQHFAAIDPQQFNFAPIAKAIPLEVLSKYIGVPKDYQKEFEGLSHAALATYDPTETIDLPLALRGIAMLKDLVAERRKHPQDDLLSALAATVEDGERLNETEMLALLAGVLAAGPDTTRDHLANQVFVLATHPEAWQYLRDHPAQIENVVKECIRWRSFGHIGATRFALEDMEVLGQKIHKGEMVRLMVQCAFQDELVFPHPERLDPQRPNLDDVMYFGAGPYYCLGASLARAITEEVLGAMMQRYNRLELIEAPVYAKNMISFRMEKLLLRAS